jgi:hypothetical protein
MNFSKVNSKLSDFGPVSNSNFVDGHIDYLNQKEGREERYTCTDKEYIEMDFKWPYMMFYEIYRYSNYSFVFESTNGEEIVFFTEDGRMIECYIGRTSATIRPLTNRLLDKIISEFEKNEGNDYYQLLDLLDTFYDSDIVKKEINYIDKYKEKSQFKKKDIKKVLKTMKPDLREATNYTKRKEKMNLS